MVYADEYSQPEAPDPVLSDDRVLELARRHAPKVRRVSAIDETGGEARVYMCDDDIVFKTQRPQQLRPRTSLEKEAFILSQLAAATAVPIPRVLGYGCEDDVEYIVLTRVPGVALATTSLTGPARVAVLEELGATLRRIHDIDQAAMAASSLVPGDRGASDLRERLSGMFERLISALADDDRWSAEIDLHAVSERCLEQIPDEAPVVTLHSNPGGEHCFVDPATSRFTGLIDFGDAYRSHPALDVRAWRSPDDSAHMLAGYRALGPLSPGFEHVWRAGLVVTHLRLGSRGYHEPADAADEIRKLLGPQGESEPDR
jgi:hygromycin-B 7''-O-kinase